jgi:hypothetical protein
VQARIEKHVEHGRVNFPDEVHIQTRTALYGRVKWVNLHGLEQSWQEARLDAKVVNAQTVEMQTRNVSRIVFYPPPQVRGRGDKLTLKIDGQDLKLQIGPELPKFENFLSPGPRVPHSLCRLIKANGQWRDFGNATPFSHEGPSDGKGGAHPGPMDASFMKRFLVVLPDGQSSSTAVEAWVQAESAHFLTRWRSLMRGDVRVAKASEITDIDKEGQTQSLILWGTPESNSCIRRLLSRLPVQWDAEKVGLKGKASVDARSHVLALTYPALKSAGFEVVINSGLTFREAHDRTNSLQNPKLPDWALLDITQAPSPDAAAKVIAADFFDELWQVK